MIASRYVAALAVLAVVAVVAAALFTLGPQSETRAHALDLKRVEMLQDLASSIDGVYAKKALPARLRDVPDDPVSGKPYEYRRISDRTYELCATFERPSTKDDASASAANYVYDHVAFDRHPAGRFCSRFDVPDR